MHGVAVSLWGVRSPWVLALLQNVLLLTVPVGPQRLPAHAHMVFMSPEWLKSCIGPNQLVHAKMCDM